MMKLPFESSALRLVLITSLTVLATATVCLPSAQAVKPAKTIPGSAKTADTATATSTLKVNYLILTRSGVDSAGRSADERFELTADGLVKWQVSGTADGNDLATCDTLGGRFQKRISLKEAENLAKLAAAAAQSQPQPKDKSRSPREITNSLTTAYDGKVLSKPIEASTPQLKAFMTSVSALKLELAPQSVVAMKAKPKGKSLSVEFKLEGKMPMRIYFPPDANEAFHIEGQKVSYSKKPTRNEIELTPKNPKFELKLSSEKDLSKVKMLNYSNALVLHHQKPEGKFGLPPQALNLCSSL
jgi:hypothetical protein